MALALSSDSRLPIRENSSTYFSPVAVATPAEVREGERRAGFSSTSGMSTRNRGPTS